MDVETKLLRALAKLLQAPFGLINFLNPQLGLAVSVAQDVFERK